MTGSAEKTEEFYKQTAVRKDWNNPTYAEMVESLNKAHDVNRAMAKDIGQVRSQLLRSKIKNYALVGVLSAAAAAGIEQAVRALLHRFFGL